MSDPTLAFHVKQYVPQAEGDELAHRITLLKARDHAAALRGRTDGWLATECACHAHDIAGRFVFRLGESVPRLEMAANLCRYLVRAALTADSLNSEDDPL
ncbi:hypothetical protein SOQ14_12045 [Erythrobacter sp. T5W1-R]|uniref:hypothetical protein n=1 Tax=Erythrobacter sp. T5W1-R TaxID=3101752 RepID=UPI002B001063|nr:hypothetical protein [Erythrobacter sp. T5W1-R]MEA1619649.1 hypothetical protein [Erythrobacter sp. T5W1-R]